METEKLKSKLEETLQILIELKHLENEIKFISNRNEYYFENVVEKSDFFYRAYRNSIRLFIIDLFKLMEIKEHYSLKKTIDFAISNRNNIEWERNCNFKKLESLKNRIDVLNENYLDKIKVLRNKFFAHNDKHKSRFKNKPKLSECWICLSELIEVFQELSLLTNNFSFLFSTGFSEIIGEIISLSKFEETKKIIQKMNSNHPNNQIVKELRAVSVFGKKASK